jgi:general secretion pathway protein A
VILIGQPSLLDALAQDHLRQLDSRVSVRASLKPLGRGDVEAYVSHRLSVAGNSGGVRFDSGAIDAVTALSGGLPRLINLLCDRALMAGSQAESRAIDAAIVHEAGDVLGMTAPEAPSRASRRPWHRWLWIVAALVVLVVGGLRVAATQRIDPPPAPDAPAPAPRAAAIQPRPLPDPSEYPPDPTVQRPVALPTFGPQ